MATFSVDIKVKNIRHRRFNHIALCHNGLVLNAGSGKLSTTATIKFTNPEQREKFLKELASQKDSNIKGAAVLYDGWDNLNK